jgi:hypothetical protein
VIGALQFDGARTKPGHLEITVLTEAATRYKLLQRRRRLAIASVSCLSMVPPFLGFHTIPAWRQTQSTADPRLQGTGRASARKPAQTDGGY